MNTSNKKNGLYHASSSLLGLVLILSLMGSLWISSLDGLKDLCNEVQNQWNHFTESLSLIQPHRTVFPH